MITPEQPSIEDSLKRRLKIAQELIVNLRADNKELELQRIDLWDEVCQLQELVGDAFDNGHAAGWNRENGDLAWKAWSYDKHQLYTPLREEK